MVEEEPDRLGRWFAKDAPGGDEEFAARLLFHTRTLEVAWTNSIPWLAHRVRAVQDCSGLQVDIVRGRASDVLLDEIRSGAFNPDALALRFARILGGEWTVTVEPIPGSDDAWSLTMSKR
jgi:hypothetical protein